MITLLDRYGYMVWMREFELACLEGVPTREIHGELHSGIGQEAIGAGMAGFLRTDDAMCSTHRNHLHAIAKGVDMRAMLAEIFERETKHSDIHVTPSLVQATVDDFLDPENPLRHECFGPAAVIVEYRTPEEALLLAGIDEGVLVSCLHAEGDDPQTPALLDVLSARSGRLVWNGWPTGVAVTPWQMHGGTYPASTNPLHTSVGLTAAARFARPVVWQGFPPALTQ